MDEMCGLWNVNSIILVNKFDIALQAAGTVMFFATRLDNVGFLPGTATCTWGRPALRGQPDRLHLVCP